MGPRITTITETCPRCEGGPSDPHNRNKPCIRCHGKKVVTDTVIELPPAILTQLSLDNPISD